MQPDEVLSMRYTQFTCQVYCVSTAARTLISEHGDILSLDESVSIRLARDAQTIAGEDS